MAKEQVCLGLVASSIAFQPIDHVVVEPDGDWALGRTVEAADLRTGPVDNLGHIGEINRSVDLCGDGGDVPLVRGCELPHTTSFPGQMRLLRRSRELPPFHPVLLP